MKKIISLSILFSLALTGCFKPKSDEPTVRPQDPPVRLTFEEAQERSQRISQVSYQLQVSLDETSDYSGKEKVTFNLADTAGDVVMDYFKEVLKSVVVNGKPVTVTKTRGHFFIPQQSLKKGTNEVLIEYTSQTQTDGSGLHRFKDPENKNIFLYTQFEAYDANKFMPCFDQPDLKATMEMTVTAPAAWTVVTTTRESNVKVAKEGFKTWTFPKTKKLSTYLFSLHAGPFRVWEDSYQGIPLRLMIRPQLAKYVDPQLWFTVTKQGLGFYNKYFDYKYPFEKYDQLIVPEFNAGAMENTGAVTFSERFVTRGKQTRMDEARTSSVLLHEMAHMWFGDLVTMKWWSDLWLNESFATYMSVISQASATKYKEAGRDSFDYFKIRAYLHDGRLSTHPVEAITKDTLEAGAHFDGITYGKGFSVLKQISHLISEAAFQKGVQIYLKEHAFANAELKDFIGALEKASGKSLMAWSSAWLTQAGVDTIHPSFRCENKHLSEVSFEVSPQLPGTFRTQTIDIAFYKKKDEKLSLLATKTIEISKSHQDWPMSQDCPDFLMVNAGDYGYVKALLDPVSFDTIKSHINDLQSPVDRVMTWWNLWEMVRDQNMGLKDYADLVLKQGLSETDLGNLRMIMSTVIGDRMGPSLNNYWPDDGPNGMGTAKKDWMAKLEKAVAAKAYAAKAGSDEQLFWWDSLVSIARSQAILKNMAGLLQNPNKLPKGMILDQDRRWDIVNALCRLGFDQCPIMVDAEKARDISERGVKSAIACLAIQPQLEVKRTYFKMLLESKDLSYQQKISLAYNLFPFEQRGLADNFKHAYFDFMDKHQNSDDQLFMKLVAGNLSPVNCDADQASEMDGFLKKHPAFPPETTKAIQDLLESDVRCQKVRARLMKTDFITK